MNKNESALVAVIAGIVDEKTGRVMVGNKTDLNGLLVGVPDLREADKDSASYALGAHDALAALIEALESFQVPDATMELARQHRKLLESVRDAAPVVSGVADVATALTELANAGLVGRTPHSAWRLTPWGALVMGKVA